MPRSRQSILRPAGRTVAAIALLAVPVLAGAHGEPLDAVTATSQVEQYEPTVESLSRHEVPDWYNDAKFGIFIHWGPTAVGQVHDWYQWAYNQPGSSTYEHHRQVWGEDFDYDDFFPLFTAANYDPNEWVELFEDAGAKYFVLTSKHHDGYALYPSATTDRDSVAQPPHRDLVGELFAAAKQDAPGLRRGLYYSMPEFFHPNLPFELVRRPGWGGPPHNPYTGGEIPYTGYTPIDDYVQDHQKPQMLELIDNYEPEIFWCDANGVNDSLAVIAHYYNKDLTDPDLNGVVVNNRCGPPANQAADFSTPERRVLGDIDPGKWETADVMGEWFYNEQSRRRGAEALIEQLVDVVSKNGNLLLNISPRPDGTIPDWQQQNLREMGEWLRINGEAIYGSTYWSDFQDVESNVPVRFTAKGDRLYLTALEWPGEQLTLSGDLLPVGPASEIRLLGSDGAALPWQRDGDAVSVRMPPGGQAATTSQHAYTFAITTPGVRQLVRSAVDAPDSVEFGGTFTGSVTVTNPGPRPTDDPNDEIDGRVSLEVPAGWTVQPKSVNVGAIPANESRVAEFRVTAPTDGEVGRHELTAHISFGRMTYHTATAALTLGDNVALRKPATQSSTHLGLTADRAVDGSTDGIWSNGSVSHTSNEQNAWWQVDLGGSYTIGEIDVWNRTDCCTGRLRDYYVLVSDEPLPPSLDEALATPGVWASRQSAVAGRPTRIPVGASGRHVRIQLAGQNWLTLAEVQVIASPH